MVPDRGDPRHSHSSRNAPSVIDPTLPTVPARTLGRALSARGHPEEHRAGRRYPATRRGLVGDSLEVALEPRARRQKPCPGDNTGCPSPSELTLPELRTNGRERSGHPLRVAGMFARRRIARCVATSLSGRRAGGPRRSLVGAGLRRRRPSGDVHALRQRLLRSAGRIFSGLGHRAT